MTKFMTDYMGRPMVGFMNAKIDQELEKKLIELCAAYDMTKADVLRMAIGLMYQDLEVVRANQERE